MINTRLKNFLDDHQVRYKTIIHSPAYTAQEIAQSAHIHGMNFMKTVIARADDKFIMLVLPAHYRIDTQQLQESLEAKKISLASEDDFYASFPQCEAGAMPPFGNLFDMPVYLAPCFDPEQDIAFNAGNHTQLIQMSFSDYLELAQPHLLKSGYTAPGASAPKMREHGGKHFIIH